MFKPGDKVRALQSSGFKHFSYKKGEVYTVSKIGDNGYVYTKENDNAWGPQFFELVEEKKERQKFYFVSYHVYNTLEGAKAISEGKFEIREVELVAVHTPSVPEVTYTRKEV